MSLKLLAIETELTGPDREAAFARHDGLLAGLDGRLSALLQSGLTREAFVRAEQLKDATLVARKLLRLVMKEGGTSSSGMPGGIN